MSLFESITWTNIKQAETSIEEPKFKLPCIGEGALYEKNTCTVLMTTTEDWEWGQLSLELDCDGPPANHWLSYELDAMGQIGDILDIVQGNDVDRFLLENGIAPFQRFYMRISAHYSRDYWGECDSDIEGWVLNIEPWDDVRIATEWEAFIARKNGLIMPWLGGKLTK